MKSHASTYKYDEMFIEFENDVFWVIVRECTESNIREMELKVGSD